VETNSLSRAADELEQLRPTGEVPEPDACLRMARACFAAEDTAGAYEWLARVADSRGPYVVWASAAGALAKFEEREPPLTARTARVAVVGSYTTSQFVALLRLAALRRRVRLEVYEAGFDLFRQEILDPRSGLYAFEPEYVIVAPHEGVVRFPALTEASAVQETLEAEVGRWRALWDALAVNSSTRVVQHNFALRPESTWGHLAARMPGSRDRMLRRLNRELADAAGDDVLIVDCDRVAAAFGKDRWFDDRYWHLAKQAVALDALPELARHTAAVVAAAEGLSSKCLVLDLDNTLWGGVIAEDGLSGIQLGGGPQGEAFIAFHEYLISLRSRGILLAVASKNNPADAREPFEQHPDTRLRLDDFAAFHANWDDKPASLRTIASELNIGLDSLVFVDDNPAEREVVRRLLPEVEVIALPPDPSGYIRAVSDSLLFELASLTKEDLGRAAQYQARAAAAAHQAQASSLDEFYASLGMEALVSRFDEVNLPRITQLVGKTNQFNLTTRRHSMNELRSFMEDGGAVTMSLRLRDQFTDHGLVAVLIAEQKDDVLDIDTWLMSCRVIGRTVENEMLARLCSAALERGATRLNGTFIPTAKNVVVKDVFERLGFTLLSSDSGTTTWEYDIDQKGPITSEFIQPWNEPVGQP
jgi:FkbH-like protein